MNPPSMLYQVARQRQAEDRARAEAWRRSHPAPTVRSVDTPARSAPSRASSWWHLFHFPTGLLHHTPH